MIAALRTGGISVVQAPDDADVLIAMTGLKLAKENPSKRVSVISNIIKYN